MDGVSGLFDNDVKKFIGAQCFVDPDRPESGNKSWNRPWFLAKTIPIRQKSGMRKCLSK